MSKVARSPIRIFAIPLLLAIVTAASLILALIGAPALRPLAWAGCALPMICLGVSIWRARR